VKNLFAFNSKYTKKAPSPWKTIFLFLIFSLSTLIYLAFSTANSPFNHNSVEQNYSSLRLSVQQGGMAQFHKDKKELKNQIISILNSPKNEDEEAKASSIALYLFPDILPDENFEKQAALEMWAPLEAEIEKKPRSAEARMFFEELTSNIWNYENPKVSNAGLSIYAAETLKLYHAISSP
jgi:hypothetical protein